jgi:hypothetical protein
VLGVCAAVETGKTQKTEDFITYGECIANSCAGARGIL